MTRQRFQPALAVALLALVMAGCGKVAGLPTAQAAAGAHAAAKGGSFTTETFQGRTYKLFAPASAGAKAPLVVMMHGCTQNPDDFAKGTRMNELAAKEGFFVLYPSQTRQDHPMSCMPWFDTGDQQRDMGLPAQVVGMVKHVAEKAPIDANAVYVAGISAGAAFAVNVAAIYPDVFAALGVAAGLEFQAATNEKAARMPMMMGGPSPATQGQKAFAAMGKYERPMPGIVFGGTSDVVVAQVSAAQVISQWAVTNDLADDGKVNNSVDATADQTQRAQVPGGRTYTRTVYEGAGGKPLMERVVVDQMGHAWSGGDAAGSYTDPKGPDATTMMWTFFKDHAQTHSKKAK